MCYTYTLLDISWGYLDCIDDNDNDNDNDHNMLMQLLR